jgi:hypothetical protein
MLEPGEILPGAALPEQVSAKPALSLSKSTPHTVPKAERMT